MKKLFSTLTGIALLVGIAATPISAEETYLSLPAQLGELHLVEGADFLVDDIVAADAETLSYGLQAETPKGIYITQFCPTGCVDYTVGTRTYPMHGTYLAENKGCLIRFTLQDQFSAKTYADEAFTALLGENYEIIAPDSDTPYHGIIIKDAPEKAKAVADAVYAWAIADHVVAEFSFSEAYISKHEISFSGPLYAVDVYPDAEAELTAFAAEYASDWTITANSSYCQLRPSVAETDHFQLMDMVKSVYDKLGYMPYYGIMEDATAEEAWGTVNYVPNSGTVVNECYEVYLHELCYYNARTDQWFTTDGELLVVEQEPVMKAIHEGETVYVDITTQTVYTADNEVHQELTDVLPKMIDYIHVSCSGLPRDLDITFPILYDFEEDSLDFYFHYSLVEEGHTVGGVSYCPSYEGDYYEIFPWVTPVDHLAEVYTTMGDVTADGALTIADAIALSRLVAEDTTLALTPLQQSLADVDADGYVLADDITAVLRTLAGLTT